MTTRQSAKNKGRRFQAEIASVFLNTYRLLDNALEARDIVSTPASVPGVDIILSDRAKHIIPFDIECKYQEKTNIWDWLKQCEDNTVKGRIPLLVFKRNRSDTYVCLKLEDLLKLDLGGV